MIDIYRDWFEHISGIFWENDEELRCEIVHARAKIIEIHLERIH